MGPEANWFFSSYSWWLILKFKRPNFNALKKRVSYCWKRELFGLNNCFVVLVIPPGYRVSLEKKNDHSYIQGLLKKKRLHWLICHKMLILLARVMSAKCLAKVLPYKMIWDFLIYSIVVQIGHIRECIPSTTSLAIISDYIAVISSLFI